MKILHVTPHLGGGVGKAHATIAPVLPEVVEQTFVLLEPPRDHRFIDKIRSVGGNVVIADDLNHVASLARKADIVQFEFWNHPRMFECLARTEFPPIRSVFWSHISGLFQPVIPPALIEEAARFVFTTGASLSIPSVAALGERARKKIAVINSGFGFAGGSPRTARGRKPGVAYLGTVDFAKMHPGFFDAVDGLLDDDVRIMVWGDFDPTGPVAARAKAMRNLTRVNFMGQTADSSVALSNADIFLYPLQRDHYGTAENALVEAMSLGLTPLVLNNPAEMAIVSDGETGFVAKSIEEIGSLLQLLLLLPDVRAKISKNAVRYVTETRNPLLSAREFMTLWLGLLCETPRHCDLTRPIGGSPAEWYRSTQCLSEAPWTRPVPNAETASKGTLAHFETAFAVDLASEKWAGTRAVRRRRVNPLRLRLTTASG
jgi:glycosyltransferase involved in cell wall biosynthesis